MTSVNTYSNESAVPFNTRTAGGKVVNSMREFTDANKDIASKGRGHTFDVDPRVIQIQSGYNTREAGMGEEYYNLPHVMRHIEGIKEAYKAGDAQVDLMTVKVVDGVVFVRQGHCRLRALWAAIEEGAQIQSITVIEFKGDELAQELHTLDGNKGLALSACATADSYYRLKNNFGFSVDKIAQREGVSTEVVRLMLRVHELPIKLKGYIVAENLTYTLALELFEKHGTKACDVVKEELDAILKNQASLMQENASKVSIGHKANPKPVRLTASQFGCSPVPKKLARRVCDDVLKFTSSIADKLNNLAEDADVIALEISRNDILLLKSLMSDIQDADNRQAARAEKRKNKNPIDDANAPPATLHDTIPVPANDSNEENLDLPLTKVDEPVLATA